MKYSVVTSFSGTILETENLKEATIEAENSIEHGEAWAQVRDENNEIIHQIIIKKLTSIGKIGDLVWNLPTIHEKRQ